MMLPGEILSRVITDAAASVTTEIITVLIIREKLYKPAKGVAIISQLLRLEDH